MYSSGALKSLGSVMPEIDWDELETLGTEQFHDRHFRELGHTLVPGEGDNPIAFIIGEAPGAQEVIKGRPFVGPSGRVQRQLMSFAGLHIRGPWFANDEPESNCWLTNVVKFRPPQNRKPSHVEIVAARPYLRREWIAVGEPKLIIPVGATALQAILGISVSILKVAGRRMTLAERPDMAVWPMIHPSFGLRGNDLVKDTIEEHWQRLGAWRNANHA